METQVADYYNHTEKTPNIICHNQTGFQNHQILNRLERDIALLQSVIRTIADDVAIIKQYVILKKKKEDKAWF